MLNIIVLVVSLIWICVYLSLARLAKISSIAISINALHSFSYIYMMIIRVQVQVQPVWKPHHCNTTIYRKTSLSPQLFLKHVYTFS